MKRSLVSTLLAVATLLGAAAFAQTPPPAAPLGIKGDLSIRYASRQTDGKLRSGVTDDYTLNLTVAGSSGFRGTIKHRPFVRNTIGANQAAQLAFDIDGFVINPRNPAETKDIAKLTGVAPITEGNLYRFEDGTVKMTVFGTGNATGLESRFKGLAQGKPPATSSWQNRTQELLRINNSKGSVVIKRYDQMVFTNHTLAAGPVPSYGEVVIVGSMLYDYDRSAWIIQGLTVTYGVGGKRMQDTITGDIRWTEARDRATTGIGTYTFNVKVNEPPASEANVFGAASTEADFFAVNTAVPSLTGTLSYRDTIVNKVVTASAIKVDLTGSQLDKIQLMYLCKALLISAIVPVNAE